MDRWIGKVAVVTGASAGIGLAIAQALIREGMTVIGLARRKDKMESAMKGFKGKGKFIPYMCDVSNEKNVNEAFNWIKKNIGVVQVLINNAGLVTCGTLAETSKEDWDKVFNVNVMGLLMCTKHAINAMKEADVEGHIVNISSIQGHRVYSFDGLHFNVYPASKHAVTAISEGLEKELRGGKIRVTNLSPGFVKSEILQANDFETGFSNAPALQCKDIADAVLYVVGSPQRVQVAELTIRPLGENGIA